MLHIFGMGESEAAYRLRTMIERQDNPTLATYVGKGDVLLRITARTALDADPEPLLAPAVQEVEALLGDGQLEGLALKGENKGELQADGLFIAVGTTPQAPSCWA